MIAAQSVVVSACSGKPAIARIALLASGIVDSPAPESLPCFTRIGPLRAINLALPDAERGPHAEGRHSLRAPFRGRPASSLMSDNMILFVHHIFREPRKTTHISQI
jgi:hypothetical protein